MLRRYTYRFSRKRRILDMEIAIWRFSTPEETAHITGLLDSGLTLLERYAPKEFGAMRQDVRSIFVHGLIEYAGWYVPEHKAIELNERDLLDPCMSPGELACMLVHEAQHARLFRLGFGYEEAIRMRIEILCRRAERKLARRLPDSDALVKSIDAWIDADPAHLEKRYSNAGRRRTRLRILREEGCPDWIVQTLEWLESRREARTRSKNTTSTAPLNKKIG